MHLLGFYQNLILFLKFFNKISNIKNFHHWILVLMAKYETRFMVVMNYGKQKY